MRKINISWIVLSVLLLIGCKSQQNTFTKVYEKELEEAPTRVASVSPDGRYVLGIEEKPKGFGGAPVAFMVDGESGEVMWNKQMQDLGEIERSPDYIKWIWDHQKILFFSRNFDFKMSCVDMMTGEELWSFQDKKNRYSQSAFTIPGENAIMLLAPDGLAAIDLTNGERRWTRKDLQVSGGITDALFETTSGLSWSYLSTGKILLSYDGQLHLIDPSTGQSEWTINESVGSVGGADLFVEEEFAVFYGPDDESLGKSIAASTNSAVGTVMDLAESGLTKDDIIVVDLKEGRVKWRNEFITNGNHTVIYDKGRLIFSGIVINVFSAETGDLIWKNIEDDRYENDQFFKALGSLTGINMTVGERARPADLIYDEKIYAVYPLALEDATKKNRISLRKYALKDGELLWETDLDKINIRYYYGAEGVLFIVGTTNTFVPRSVLLAFDATTGEMLYERTPKATGIINVVAHKGKVFLNTTNNGVNYNLEVFNIRNGSDIPVSLPGSQPVDLEQTSRGFLIGYLRPGLLVLHDADDFSVKKKVQIPKYISDDSYRGNTFFMHELEGDPPEGIVALDLENFILKGYLLNSQQGSASFSEGNESGNLVYKDYHLFLTQDGEYIYEIDKELLKKYRVN